MTDRPRPVNCLSGRITQSDLLANQYLAGQGAMDRASIGDLAQPLPLRVVELTVQIENALDEGAPSGAQNRNVQPTLVVTSVAVESKRLPSVLMAWLTTKNSSFPGSMIHRRRLLMPRESDALSH